MKKLKITLYLLLQVILSYGQTPCDSSTVASDLDNPPGCYSCMFPFETNNFTATPDTFDYDFACGTIENSIWVSVFADSNGEIKLSINGKVCTTPEKGFEVGLYDSNLNRVGGCSSTTGITSPLQVQFRSLIPGEYYWMMIDGNNGARCSFSIERSENDLRGLEIFSTEASNSNCPGVEICYYLPITELIDSNYTWRIIPTAEKVSGGEVQDSFVCFRFVNTRDYVIDLEINGFCFETKSAVYNQKITNLFQIKGPTYSLSLCPPELPFTTENGIITEFGITEFILTAASGCDSVVTYQVDEFLIDVTTRTFFLCPDELPFTTANGVVSDFGTHDFPFISALGCDSIIRYEILETRADETWNYFELCPGELPLTTEHGELSDFGTYDFNFTSALGCDSIIRYEILETRADETFNYFQLCPGELPFTTEHGELSDFGTYDFNFTSALGCDSIIQYILYEDFQVFQQFDTISICNYHTIQVDSQLISNSGNHFFFYEDGSKKGCDSSYQLTLNIIDTIVPEIICFYDSIVQKVGIKWTPKPHVKGFDLKINDDSIRLGNRFTYLFTPTEPNQVLDISVKPFSDICTHPTAFAQCIGPSEIIVQSGNISESLKIELFPNPTSGLINLKSKIPIEKIEAFDFSGRNIFIDDFSKIDLSDEPSGIYILKIKTSDGVILKRTLKL